MAFVLAPEPPLGGWIAELDNQIQRSEGFFVGRPVVLDVSRMTLTKSDLSDLIADLRTRDIRVMGIEGADPSCLGPGSPPLLKGGRPADGIIETLHAPAAENLAIPMSGEQQPSFLLLDSPVRSGQSVVFPSGDVTVIGSVASGATFTAHCEAEPWRVRPATPARGSSAARSKQSFWRSTASIRRPMISMHRCAAGQCRSGSKVMR